MDSQFSETRAQKLGKVLASYRDANEKSIVKTASFLGITPDELMKFESGETSPSLPQLESLAHFFKVPLDALVDQNPIEPVVKFTPEKIPAIISLRNRIIAVLIKRARLDQNRSAEEIETNFGLEAGTLEGYESGKVSIPLPALEGICSILGISLNSLASNPAQPVQHETQPEVTPVAETLQLPEEIYDFVANNSNLPYLQLAKRLSEMDAAKLRNIAESLLEITY